MMLQGGKRLAGPVLEFRIVPALGVPLKERGCVLVGADLHRVILTCEIVGFGIPQLVELLLGAVVESGRKCCLHLTTDHLLELGACLGVIRDHHGGKFLFVGIALLLRDLRGLDSSISLIAASLMKSSVFGAMPSAGLTPV